MEIKSDVSRHVAKEMIKEVYKLEAGPEGYKTNSSSKAWEIKTQDTHRRTIVKERGSKVEIILPEGRLGEKIKEKFNKGAQTGSSSESSSGRNVVEAEYEPGDSFWEETGAHRKSNGVDESTSAKAERDTDSNRGIKEVNFSSEVEYRIHVYDDGRAELVDDGEVETYESLHELVNNLER